MPASTTTSRSRARTQTATIVRYNHLEREIPLFGPVAEDLRIDCFEQTAQLLDRLQSVWDVIDEGEFTSNGGVMSPETTQKIGSAFWIVGEMRDRLNDLMYLSEGAQQGQYGRKQVPSRAQQPGHEFSGGGEGDEGPEANPYR